MNLKAISLFATMALLYANAHSQWTDYGGWASATVSQKVAKKTIASLNAAMRWDRDFIRLGSTLIDTDISREILDDLDITASFRAGTSRTDEYQWELQQRFSANARYKVNLGENSSVSLRAQYQTGHKGPRSPSEGIEFSNAARTKLTYSYKASKTYKMSLSTEAFFRPINTAYQWSDWRARISLRKKVAKRKYLTIGYQIESPRGGPDPWVEHAIICNFGLEKKRRKSEK